MGATEDMVLIKEFTNVKIYEDDFTRTLYEYMCKPDIHGIDLARYRVYRYVSKIEDSYLYVMEDPDGHPFHDEHGLEAWLFYFDLLRMSLKEGTDLINMAEKKLEGEKKNGRRKFGRSLQRDK